MANSLSDKRLGMTRSGSFVSSSDLLQNKNQTTGSFQNQKESIERRDRHFFLQLKKHPWTSMTNDLMINVGAHSINLLMALIIEMKRGKWQIVTSADVSMKYTRCDGFDYRSDPCCLYLINYS